MIINGGAGASKVKAARRLSTVDGHARHRWLVALAIAAAVAVPAGGQAGGTPIRVAVLDIELLKADYLPDAHTTTEEERHRLDLVAELIRTRLGAEGYDVVPAAATRQAIREAKPLQRLHALRRTGCWWGGFSLSATSFSTSMSWRSTSRRVVPWGMRSSTCAATPNGPGGMPRLTCSITFSWTGSPRAGDGAAAHPPTVPRSAPLARLRSIRDRRPPSRRCLRDTKRSTSSSSPGHGAPHSRTSSSRSGRKRRSSSSGRRR